MPVEIGPADAFGAALRQARTARELSLRDLGAIVHYSKGHLSKIENGVVAAHRELADSCDAALGADGALTAAFLADTVRPAAEPASGPADGPFDIPAAPGAFLGRDGDLARVTGAILGPKDRFRAPVVALHGMPGVGKTALALHAAHALRPRFPGGCLYVDFGSGEARNATADVIPRLLRRLGVAQGTVPAEPQEARALYLSILYRRSVLIVADGVASAEQVIPLIPASPASALIVVGRRRLDALDDCRTLRVHPLETAEAAALFRALTDGTGAASPTDVVRIAAACGGLPLAVRIAASALRASSRTAAELADCLGQPATLWEGLDDGERSVRRTLQAAVEDLDADLRHTVTLLGLHPGRTADRAAVGWVTDRPEQVVAANLARLEAHDLVAPRGDGRVSAPGLLQTLSTELAGGLDDRTRGRAVSRLIAGHVRSATAADAVINPLRFRPAAPQGGPAVAVAAFAAAGQAMTWCRAEAEAVPKLCLLAYDQGLDAECWRLAYAMRGYFFTAKAIGPWIESHRIALMAARRCRDPWAEAVTRNNLGMALVDQGRTAEAEAEFAPALAMLREADDEHGVAVTLGHQAWASHSAGRYEAAVALAAQASALNRRLDDRRALAIMDRTAALACSKIGRHREALGHLAECAQILDEIDLPIDRAMLFNCLGEVHCAMGHFDQAAALHEQAAEQSAACGSRSEELRARNGRALATRSGGRPLSAPPPAP